MTANSPPVSIARRVLASLLAVAAAVFMRSWGPSLPVALWLPTVLLAAAAVLLHHRRLGSQLFSRAVLWSNLILGMVITVVSHGRERPIAVALAATTAAALLLVGRTGLADDTRGGSFVPVAFRATLLGLMVMALADAQSLVFFGTLEIEGWDPSPRHISLFFILGAALIVAIVGIYRLRVWGLLFGALTWIAIAGVALVGWLRLPEGLAYAFVATSALQLILAAPLFVAMWTGARQRA